MTQSYVDKCLIDEIAYFINLHSRHQHHAYNPAGVRSVAGMKREPVWTTPKAPVKKRMTSGQVGEGKVSTPPTKALATSPSPVKPTASPVKATSSPVKSTPALGEDSNSNNSTSSIPPITTTATATTPSTSHSFSADFLAGGGTTGVTLTPTSTVAAAPKKRKQSGADGSGGVKKPRGEKKKKSGGAERPQGKNFAIKNFNWGLIF